MAKRNPEFYRNDIPVNVVISRSRQLIEEAGDCADDDYIAIRAGRGWCVAEIARGHAMRHFEKGSLRRRQVLTEMSRLGAPRVTGL